MSPLRKRRRHRAAGNPTTASPVAGTNDNAAARAQLRRFQWAVRATLTIGVAASVSANVLHARHNPISQAIAAWSPLALLLAIEIVSRVPVHRRALTILRIVSTFVIAGIAAYVSYSHMSAVAAHYGETGLAPYLLPISVDGLIVVASVSLVELSGRLQATAATATPPREQSAETPAPGQPQASTPPETPSSPITSSNGHPSVTENPPPPPVAPPPPLPPPPVASPPVTPPTDRQDQSQDNRGDEPERPDEDNDEPADLIALLPAARAARDDLHRQGRALTRDALAAQLRRNGHSIRTSRASALLSLIRDDTPAETGPRVGT